MKRTPLALAAALAGVLTLGMAGSAQADNFSIGFGYSSGGHHGSSYRGNYSYSSNYYRAPAYPRYASYPSTTCTTTYPTYSYQPVYQAPVYRPVYTTPVTTYPSHYTPYRPRRDWRNCR